MGGPNGRSLATFLGTGTRATTRNGGGIARANVNKGLKREGEGGGEEGGKGKGNKLGKW